MERPHVIPSAEDPLLPRSQGQMTLEDLVLVGILHRLFGFAWEPIRSLAARFCMLH